MMNLPFLISKTFMLALFFKHLHVKKTGALAFSVETLHKFAFISNQFGRASFQEIDELSKFSIFFTNLFMVLSHICIKSIMIFKFFSLFIYYF